MTQLFFDKGPKISPLPSICLLNNIEFDHADIYDSIEEIEENFGRLMKLCTTSVPLVANADDDRVVRCAAAAQGPTLWFSVESKRGLNAQNVETEPEGTRFDLYEDETFKGRVFLPMSGRHNVGNLLAAFQICRWLGVNLHDLIDGTKGFLGTDKRQEEKGEVDGVLIIDDFAHHPTAIRETLSGLKTRYHGRRMWAVYEPKSNTARRNIHQEAYLASFRHADRVVVATPFQKNDGLADEDKLNVSLLCNQLTESGVPASSPGSADDIVSYLSHKLESGDVVVVMANSGFDGLVGKLMTKLSDRAVS